MLPNTFDELNDAMNSTEQMKGLSVYAHGLMVNEEYKKLMQSLRDGTCTEEVLQEIYNNVHGLILDDITVQRYQVYHDCGKPYCRTVDEDGKVHFPDHANVSSAVWNKLFPLEHTIQDLMRLDMEWHTISLHDADMFWTHSLAPTLYFTAWAEVLANCQMFGGTDSTSFKIKRKKLVKCGKKILK